MSRLNGTQENPYEAAIVKQLTRLQTSLSYEEVVKAGRRIFGWLSPTNSLDSTLNRYLAASTPIITWAMETETHEAAASNLLGVLTHLYVAAPVLDGSGQTIKEATSRYASNVGIELISPEGRKLRKYCVTALETLTVAYLQRELAYHGIKKYIPSTSNWGKPDELNRRADDVTERIVTGQMYGVKPCVMEDGILHAPGTAWVFLDGTSDYALIPENLRRGMRVPLAYTRLAKKGEVTDFKATVRHMGPRRNLLAINSSYRQLLPAVIQSDGTLTADGTYGLWPLEDVFRAVGMEEIYPAFRLAHLMRLCDLIVPETLQREYGVPAWPSLPKKRTDRDAHRKSLPEQFRRLQIPRIRMMDDLDAIKVAQAQEIQEDRELTAHRTRQSPEHVTWFWRRLPRGHKASPEALKRSMEDRGELPPEGYTYVAERGVAPGHRAVRRNPTLE